MRALQTGDHRNACVKILRHQPIHATFWVSPTNKQRGIRGDLEDVSGPVG